MLKIKYKIEPTNDIVFKYLSNLRFFSKKDTMEYLKNNLHKHFKIVNCEKKGDGK